jgi:hypothetical protein
MAFEPQRDEIFLDSAFHRRLRHWVVLEFIWTWRLVRPSR